MKTKIISIAIGATVFVVSNIFGYNIYKDADNQNVENLKSENTISNLAQYVDEEKDVVKGMTENFEEGMAENSEKVMTENSEKVMTNTKSEDDVNSQNSGTNIYTYNENKTSNTENKQVNINQNNEYNVNDNKTYESKNTSQNTEQKKSISKFTVFRCGDEATEDDKDGFLIDKKGIPVCDLYTFGDFYAKFNYIIDFDLNNKTASVRIEYEDGAVRAGPKKFNLTDAQVEQLKKIYGGDIDPSESEYDEIYYQVESEEYENDCDQIFVTSDDKVEFLDKFIYEFWHIVK